MTENIKVLQKSLRRVYGVDFSGAEDAGKKIWIAGGVIKDGVMVIEKCFKAEALAEAGEGLIFLLAFLRNSYVKKAGNNSCSASPNCTKARKGSGQDAAGICVTGNSKESPT